MKKISTLFFIISLVYCSFAANYKVLFIGNSYTSVNDLPQLLSNIATSTGDTITYSESTPGGCTFQQHITESAALIQQGGWDYVILQEQSQLPSFPYNQFMSESYPYAQELCEMVRQYNPNAEIVFYMTWGRKNGDEVNCVYYPPLCTYEGMDSLLYARYMMMAEDNQTKVSPVGHVWHYIRDNYPNIELYQSDESHPSLEGSYVAACCFYAILFQNDPSNISFESTLETNVADIIKSSVKLQVYDSLSKWDFTDITDDNSGLEAYSSLPFSIYPNPVRDCLNIQLTSTAEHYDIEIFNLMGKLVKHVGQVHGKEVRISVEDLETGVYFIKLRSKDRNLKGVKFIKVE